MVIGKVVIKFCNLAAQCLHARKCSHILSGRSLHSTLNLSEALEALTGSQTVQDFMATPLEDFVRRVVGVGDERAGRSFETVGDALGRAAAAAKPALGLLDYDNAFEAVQVRSRGTTFSCLEL